MDLWELKGIFCKSVQPQGTSGELYCNQHLSYTWDIH